MESYNETDINKGVQAQTAECIVLGEILTKRTQLLMVLNKMGLFEESGHDRAQRVRDKLTKKQILATRKEILAAQRRHRRRSERIRRRSQCGRR